MSSNIKRMTAAGIFTVVALYAVVSLRGPQGMSALLEKRREIQTLQDENARLAREIQAKRDRIERLKHTEAEQELEIRKQLKLQRQSDTTFMLPDQKTDSPSK